MRVLLMWSAFTGTVLLSAAMEYCLARIFSQAETGNVLLVYYQVSPDTSPFCLIIHRKATLSRKG